MRICVVTPYFPSSHFPNYVEGMHLLREARLLRKRGHEFVVVTCRRRGFRKFEIVEGIPVYRVSAFVIPKINYPIPNLLRFTGTLTAVIKKHKVELLDFWDQSYLTSLPIILLKRITKIPITVTVGGLSGINWFYGERFVDLVGLVHSFSVAKLLLTQVDGVRSEFYSMNRVLSRLGVPSSKIRTVKRGVDTAVFRQTEKREDKRKELAIREGNVVILYSGRFERVKGLDFLIEAAKRLLEKYNNLTFMFVGEGSLRKKYEEMTQGFRRNMMFLGFRSDVAELMNAADIFVLPSIGESAAISVLEANACGLPVIASAVGGIPEIIKDGVNGVCVEPRNVSQLTETLGKLIATPLLAEEMGKRGSIFVNQNFSDDIVAARVEEYYQWLVDLHG